MKKRIIFALVAAVLSGAWWSCTSIPSLTPQVIKTNIGIEHLKKCQFYISKPVTLRYEPNNIIIPNVNQKSGVVQAQRFITRRYIVIDKETPGILQTKNNVGEDMPGYHYDNATNTLTLYILFEKSNDNVIPFEARYNVDLDKFELRNTEVTFDSLQYKVTFEGEERPYLYFELLERVRKEEKTRKAQGRRVGR